MRDYEGDYDEFLEKNEDEAAKMAVKEERVKVIEQVLSNPATRLLPNATPLRGLTPGNTHMTGVDRCTQTLACAFAWNELYNFLR